MQVHFDPRSCFGRKTKSKRSIYIQYFPQNFDYYGYTFYFMITVMLCLLFIY